MYLGTHFGIFSRTSIQELGIYIDYLVPLKLEWSGYLMIKVGAVIPLFGIFQQSAYLKLVPSSQILESDAAVVILISTKNLNF